MTILLDTKDREMFLRHKSNQHRTWHFHTTLLPLLNIQLLIEHYMLMYNIYTQKCNTKSDQLNDNGAIN